MTPSLYDLLDVEPSASTDEIRAAWKAAIADLDPSDRRFRAYNQAAETLLDPGRRAAYDAEVAADEPEVEPEPEPAAEPEPEPGSVVPEKRPEPEPEDEPEPAAEDEPEPAVAPTRAPGWRERTVPVWQLAVAAVLAVLVLAGTIWVAVAAEDAAGKKDRADAREQGVQQAETVAEEAAGPVLSYDYRDIDADVARATPYLTEEYAEEYRGLMEQLATQAKKDKLVVTAESVATGVVRSGDDRAEILVFVNQDATRAGAEQDQLRMWVTMTMVDEGDGWLVDEMKVDTVVPS